MNDRSNHPPPTVGVCSRPNNHSELLAFSAASCRGGLARGPERYDVALCGSAFVSATVRSRMARTSNPVE